MTRAQWLRFCAEEQGDTDEEEAGRLYADAMDEADGMNGAAVGGGGRWSQEKERAERVRVAGRMAEADR
jgi:hypothetical protein